MENENPKQPRSALAIAGLVLGILGLVTSLLPFINNVSFFVALIGAALAIAGLVTCMPVSYTHLTLPTNSRV